MTPRPVRPARPQRPKPQRPHRARPIRPERPSDPTPDPLAAVTYTDSLETDAASELTALETAYRQRATNEAQRFTAATDSEHWFAVCFQNRQEKEAFLRAIGLGGHKDPDKYITGRQLAAAVGITY